jgi:hypothetical protein
MTLVEIMVATSIMVTAMIMILGFFTETTESTFVSGQKSIINNDIRTITNEMTLFARQANVSLLYNSYEAADRDAVTDRLGESLSGDFLLLVYMGDPEVNSEGQIEQKRPVSRLIGYYRAAATADEPGPVMKFDVAVPTANRFDAIEDIIANVVGPTSSHSEVIEFSEGLANGRLFYNYRNEAIMVNGKIVHGNQAKRVTNTYNFTISTRG